MSRYYDMGGIQTWDFIIAKKLDFLEGNVVKYIVRWKDKGGLEDLVKARTYINKLIQGEQQHLGIETTGLLKITNALEGE